MLSRALALLLAGACLAACGAQEGNTVDTFSGEERRVAEVIQRLQTAAEDADGAQICGALLTPQLSDRLKAGARSCGLELEDALADADEFGVAASEVAVNGTSATARVQDGEGALRTVDLVRQGTKWRIAAIRPS